MSEKRVVFEIGGKQIELALPPPGRSSATTSVFLLGLPKAGSTLLNRLMRPITGSAGLSWFAVQEVLRGLGVKPVDFPAVINDLYAPQGYAFGGYRSLPGALSVPDFASGRAVLLVRDPRDMLTSLYYSIAVSHAPPGSAVGKDMQKEFDRRREETVRSSIDSFVIENMATTLGQFGQIKRKLQGISHKVYRYEDVIFSKQTWVADMLEYLKIDVPAEVVARVVAENDVRPAEENAGQHIRRVAPGDHQAKLLPETIERLNEGFATVFREFNYT